MSPIVGSFYSFAFNYAIKLFLDRMSVHETTTYTHLLFPIVLFLTTQFMLDIACRASDIAEWKAEPFVRRSILLKSYDYVQHHSYGFFQDNFTGTISSKIKGLLDGYDKFWAAMHHGLMAKLLKVIVSFIALSFINLHVCFYIFIWSITYASIMYFFSKRLNHYAFLETESRHSLMGQISDKITNIITLFSFASRRRELNNLNDQVVADFTPKQINFYKYNFKMQIVACILYWIMFGVLLFYMIHLKMNHMISIGDFAFVFGIVLISVEDIWEVTTSLQDFSRDMGNLKSALSILQEPQASLDIKGAVPLKIKRNSIELKDVWFGYKENIFKDLNLKINPGEKIGLVGASGAGKSSLVHLLLRYFKTNQGQILIDGQDVNLVTQDSLRENIAVIPQDTMLFHQSIMENIRYGKIDATDKEVYEASKKAHIHDYIKELPEGYNTEVGERGIKLSGGQRQRIAIARAILKDAPILILDEATSALDSQTEQLIQNSLEFLIQDQRKTVIAIAHRLSTLKNMDRIVVLNNGNIVEEGTHETLIKKKGSLYKQLWEQQEI